jgi:hypothetical protein
VMYDGKFMYNEWLINTTRCCNSLTIHWTQITTTFKCIYLNTWETHVNLNIIWMVNRYYYVFFFYKRYMFIWTPENVVNCVTYMINELWHVIFINHLLNRY